jgi:hypothetical protein
MAIQFQLLLCFTASLVDTAKSTAHQSTNKSLNKLMSRGMSVEVETKPIHTMLSSLLKQLGIDIAPSVNATANSKATTFRASASMHIGADDDDPFTGSVVIPNSFSPDDLYTRASKNSREVMVMRMEKIFDEVDARLQSLTDIDGEVGNADLLDEFSSEMDDASENRLRHMSKPVVIGDSIPPPLSCPTTVQHVSIVFIL